MGCALLYLQYKERAVSGHGETVTATAHALSPSGTLLRGQEHQRLDGILQREPPPLASLILTKKNQKGGDSPG